MSFEQWYDDYFATSSDFYHRPEARQLAEVAWNAAAREAEKPKQLVGVRCIYDWAQSPEGAD